MRRFEKKIQDFTRENPPLKTVNPRRSGGTLRIFKWHVELCERKDRGKVKPVSVIKVHGPVGLAFDDKLNGFASVFHGMLKGGEILLFEG